jgi:DNA repair ATPase RecN
MSFPKKFNDDLRAWRRTRPEYKALTDAIKRGADSAALTPLADAAGFDVSETNELIIFHGRVKTLQERAKQLPQAVKAADAINARWRELDKKLGTATSLNEQDEASCELEKLSTPRREANFLVDECRHAADNLKIAESLGLA